MDTFFVSLLVILAGGIAGLLFNRQFTLMKLSAIIAMSAGCGIGLYFTFAQLLNGDDGMVFSFHWLHLFTLAFNIDSISLFFLIPIFVIPPLALLYSFQYLDNKEKKNRAGANYFFFSILVVSMAFVVMSANMITFLLAWELMSLSSFFLVMYDYEIKVNRKAGHLYFIFAQGGAMFLFAAFSLIYNHTGSFDFASFSTIPDTIQLPVFILAFIGFGSKAGIFPLHIWLPKAHPAAPSHISAIMSGVMIKTGIYGILRMYAILDLHTPLFGNIVLIAGMISGILGIVYALGQHDLGNQFRPLQDESVRARQ